MFHMKYALYNLYIYLYVYKKKKLGEGNRGAGVTHRYVTREKMSM